MSEMQRTFVMIKPDGVQRTLIGEIIGRFEKKGLKLVAMKLMQVPAELAARHYAEHRGKPFYDGLISFITSGPVVAMAWEGDDAVTLARSLIGATDPGKAVPGTIRGDLAIFTGNNLVHGSDSGQSAERELTLFFNGQFCEYSHALEPWVYGE